MYVSKMYGFSSFQVAFKSIRKKKLVFMEISNDISDTVSYPFQDIRTVCVVLN